MRRWPMIASSRFLQLLGLAIAFAGIAGFWWPREPERTQLTVSQANLLNPRGEEFTATFVVAGRDFDATSFASACQWIGGECIRNRTGTFTPSNRTDTILFVSIIGDSISVVAIPRDLYLVDWQTKINAMLLYRQADGLREAVAEVLGVPVDYYAIIDVDIFEGLVNALDGVDINVPYRMYYRDSAAGLLIDLEPGPQRLDGSQTAGFVRFRDTPRGDIGRIDNVKLVAYALLERIKQLNVRAVGAVPQLLEAVFDDVETNASLGLITRLLPRLGSLTLDNVATLPVTGEYRVEGVGAVVGYDPREIELFLADLFGGAAREFAGPPDEPLLITNRSGSPGLAEWYADRLLALGVPEEQLLLREETPDPAPTRVAAVESSWLNADFYTGLMGIGKQQVDNMPSFDGRRVGLELVLGEGAAYAAGWHPSSGQQTVIPEWGTKEAF